MNSLKGEYNILKIFNSDFIAGKYNEDINNEFTKKLAYSLLSVYESNNITIVIGNDDKKHSKKIKNILSKELSLIGINVIDVGETTPGAVSYSTFFYKTTCAVFICTFKESGDILGFKIYNGNGFAITNEQLSKLEYLHKQNKIVPKTFKGTINQNFNFNEFYVSYLKSLINLSEINLKLAFYIKQKYLADLILKLFNNTVEKITIYDNFTINYENENKFDFHIKINEDLRKIDLYDSQGNKIENDFLISFFILAKKSKKIVTNILSNNAYFNLFDSYGIEYYLAKMGEENIVSHMLLNNVELGGDKLGLLFDFSVLKTSDALATCVNFIHLYSNSYKVYSNLEKINLNPQIIKKVAYNEQKLKSDIFLKCLSDCENILGDSGKVIVVQDKLNNQIKVFVESTDYENTKYISDKLISLL